MFHRLLALSLLVMSTSACSDDSARDPRQIPAVPADPNFTLYVSNQSFDIDPVAIDVLLDQELSVEGGFLVEGQHSWHEFHFHLSPGSHLFEAHGDPGGAEVSKTFDFGQSSRYAVLDFWYYPADNDYGVESTPPQFTLQFLADPPQFGFTD